MKKIWVLSILLLACLTGAGAGAGDLQLDWNSNSARAGYGWEAADDRLNLNLGWLHDEDLGEVAHMSLHLTGDVVSSAALVGGIGGKLVYFDALADDGFGIALGGYVSYRLPETRVRFSGELYFAPDVLTADNAKRYREGTLRVGVRFVEGAEVFAGYRYINVKFDGGFKSTLDEDVHVGLALHF